jgi:hypothetical protein
MTELPTPEEQITYEWIERESQLFSYRATFDRARLQEWIDKNLLQGTAPEELDAEDIGEFIDNNPEAAISQRRWAGDEVVVEAFDLKVVEP